MGEIWKKCSSCKGDIAQGATYWTCSVSTCNKARTPWVFCQVSCWEAHLPTMRHREAFAVENTAPQTSGEEKPQAERRKIVSQGTTSAPNKTSVATDEVLVVASKMKKYVKSQWGLNTSDNVMQVLSKALRQLCDDAAQNARKAGRKTLMDRDFS